MLLLIFTEKLIRLLKTHLNTSHVTVNQAIALFMGWRTYLNTSHVTVNPMQNKHLPFYKYTQSAYL